MWFGESAGQGGVQIGELGMAFLLSALIGLEREIRHKSASLRTHTLVGFSAALIIGAGLPILAIFVTGLHFVMVFAFPLVVERLPRSKWTPSGLQVSYQDGKGILRSVLVKLSEIPGVVAVNALAPTLTLDCQPCGRKGVYSIVRLQAKHGDARLTDLRALLTADCPNRAKRSIHAQCSRRRGGRSRRGEPRAGRLCNEL